MLKPTGLAWKLGPVHRQSFPFSDLNSYYGEYNVRPNINDGQSTVSSMWSFTSFVYRAQTSRETPDMLLSISSCSSQTPLFSNTLISGERKSELGHAVSCSVNRALCSLIITSLDHPLVEEKRKWENVSDWVSFRALWHLLSLQSWAVGWFYSERYRFRVTKILGVSMPLCHWCFHYTLVAMETNILSPPYSNASLQ